MSIGWGVAGTGRIAVEVGQVIAAHPQMAVVAVGSRDLGRATGLAARLGGSAYGSYADLVNAPGVDAVYVATPHAGHAEVVELALAAGKAVLCEKPLTHLLSETERLVALAQRRGTFMMEAMWMRFNPLAQQLATLVSRGELGEVRSVSASFGFIPPYDAANRLWDNALGGGALLDVGIYPVELARWLLGEPITVHVSGMLAPTGVDREASLLLTFPGGARALLEASFVHAPPSTAVVTGTRGRAELGPRFHAPTRLVVDVDGRRTELAQPDPLAGFVGELEEVARCIAAGRAESELMPLTGTVATMRILHEAQRQIQEQTRVTAG